MSGWFYSDLTPRRPMLLPDINTETKACIDCGKICTNVTRNFLRCPPCGRKKQNERATNRARKRREKARKG